MLVRLLVLSLVVAPVAASAQAGGTAHLYAYVVKDRAPFERGYARHLRWHARHADRLAWFAWYVTSGERAGAFVDGTFGTTPEGLAGRPDPAGDGADFRANVGAHVSAIGDEGWELWREASQATPLEQHRPGSFVRVYVLATDDPAGFEVAVAASPLAGATWYRGTGDGPARYLLMLPTRSGAAAPPIAGILGTVPAHAIRAETWRYAPHLALMPGKRFAR